MEPEPNPHEFTFEEWLAEVRAEVGDHPEVVIAFAFVYALVASLTGVVVFEFGLDGTWGVVVALVLAVPLTAGASYAAAKGWISFDETG